MHTTSEDLEKRIKPCAVCKIDLKGRIVYANGVAEKLLGHSLERLFARPFTDFLVESDHDVIERFLMQRNYYESNFETVGIHILNRSGEVIPAGITVSLNFAAGSPVNFQILVNPDTGWKLDASESPAIGSATETTDADILDDLGFGAILIDRDRKITRCNRPGKAIFVDINVGDHCRDLVMDLGEHNPSETARRIEEFIESIAAGNPCDRPALPVTLPDGETATLVMKSGSAGDDADGRGTSGLLVFVSGGRSGVQYPGRVVETELVGAFLEEVESSLAVASRFSDELGHDYYNQLDAEANFRLLRLKENLQRSRVSMAGFAGFLESLGEDCAVQETDLSLIVNQAQRRTADSRPHLTVNVQCGSLPRIIARRDALLRVISGMMHVVIGFAHGRSANIAVNAEVQGGFCQVSLKLKNAAVSTRYLEKLATFFCDRTAGAGRYVPYSDPELHITRYLVDQMGGRVETGRSAESGVFVSLLIPVHSDDGE
jgi:PAS domain S-box-containing protein